MKNWIKEIKESGKIIILDDSTIWEVDTFNRIDVRMWMRFDNVTVSGNKMTKHGIKDEIITVKRIIKLNNW